MALSVLAPITITDAMFTSSTAPETDYTAYNSGTTYAVGDRCISTTTHRIYESLKAANLNNDPTNINNRVTIGAVTAWWIDVGPTNKWALFDGLVSTQTSIASPLTVVLAPGYFNAVYLCGLDADTINVVVKDAPGGNTIYSSGTVTLEGSAPADYYEHFFERFKPLTDYLITDIDPYNGAQITLTLAKTTGNVKCGMLALGDLRPLGQTQYGAKAKPKDYSYTKIDDFGNLTVVKRKAATDASMEAWLDLAEANTVLETIQALLSVPCVWIGAEDQAYSGLRVFGLGSGEISYDYPQDCKLSLNIIGLI